MRANTVSGGGGHYLTPSIAPHRSAPPPPSVAHITINKRTFAQLHSEYGVPILRDKELNRIKKGKCDIKRQVSDRVKQEITESVSESQQADSTTENVVVMNLIDF